MHANKSCVVPSKTVSVSHGPHQGLLLFKAEPRFASSITCCVLLSRTDSQTAGCRGRPKQAVMLACKLRARQLGAQNARSLRARTRE
eukprot:826625-Pleurochrysis_carterae.AAC.16